VRLHGPVAVARALADDQRKGQRREACGDVHDGPACEVQRAELAQQPADAPDPVRDRVIDEGRPEQAEQQEGLEADALDERAGDERRGDDRKGHLEGGKGHVRDGPGVLGVRLRTDTRQPGKVEPADDPAEGGPKGERVADQDPLQADQAHHHEAEVEGGENVLPAHHAAVEEGQRRGHERHQPRGDEDPGGVARIDAIHRSAPFVHVLRCAVRARPASHMRQDSRAGWGLASTRLGTKISRTGCQPVLQRCHSTASRSRRMPSRSSALK